MSKKRCKRNLPMFLWILAIVVIWEIGATIVASTKRTPENVLPHLYQIIGAIFDDRPVANGNSAIMVVLLSAKLTLVRALKGFLYGAMLGFVLALIMKVSRIAEKIMFPYLMLIQMVPILGMAPIILAITGDINVSRVVIAAILTFFPVATNTLVGFNSVEKKNMN